MLLLYQLLVVNCCDEGNWCSLCWRQIIYMGTFYKIPTCHCTTWIIRDSCAATLTVCSRNTANKSIAEGWGQRKEIGFCQACRQVLNLEYLSHIKSTFIGYNSRPPLLSPLEVLSGCVECVSMREVLRDDSGCFFCFTALGTEERSIHSSGEGGSQFRNLLKSKATHIPFKIVKARVLPSGVFCLGGILSIERSRRAGLHK